MATVMDERIVRAIVDLTAEQGYPPSIREIGTAVGLSSTSTVVDHLRRLQDEGRITSVPNCPRTIKVVI